jgi:hypothetical protein
MGVKKRKKIPYKKVISKNVTEILTFFTFSHDRASLLNTFFGAFLNTFLRI